MIKRFLDTNILLELDESDFIDSEVFVISSQSLIELDNIKTNKNKSDSIKFKSRRISELLNKYKDRYIVSIEYQSNYDTLAKMHLPVTGDTLILSSAWLYNKKDQIEFITNDNNLRLLAEKVFNLNVNNFVREDGVFYQGYKVVNLNDDEMIYFYSNLSNNIYNNLINEYLVIKDMDNITKDIRKLTTNGYIEINKKPIKSIAFGDNIRPKDEYQKMVVDSILNNQVTAISGKAGSGKSLLSLATAMCLIESGKYDSLVILFNPTKTKGSTDMGFYGGDMINKAMQNFIGNVLITKFGERFNIDILLQQNKIKLISMADQRGMEIRDNEIMFISECQNTSVSLLKLCLSRVSQNAKVIFEGDFNSQVDSNLFENGNNGMKRAIDILKGNDIFGYIELQTIYRSKLAEIVDKM